MTVRTDRLSDFGKEQAKQVRDFCRRAHRRAGGPYLVFLFNGNGRTDVQNTIDIGPGNLVEKHPGIRGERLHVAPLAFGKQRIEGQ